ncbi:MAG: cytochrome c oxidase subunit II [Pseudomonadota bacterium]
MGHALTRVDVRIMSLLAAVAVAFAALFASQSAFAQEPAPEAPVVEAPGAESPATDAAPADAAAPVEAPAASEGGYVPMEPTKGKGMPTDPRDGEPGSVLKSMTFQDQYTDDGAYALGMHDYILLPVITVISLFVLGLLFYVIFRFNARRNPEPSRTTHNTMIEVIWTVVPVLILVVIAVPSITLLARQYETPPEEAVTIKAIGYQWYWGYEYPDHGVGEIVSNMLSDADAKANGEPAQLAVDNRMVVPANTPLRIQTTAADVIHAFAVPSLWFKMDAVPGRLNEKLLTIKEPGVYYGQCSELCGTRHAYMPIAVEALPPDEFEAWVKEQGGTMPGEEEPAAAEPAEGDAGEEAPADAEAADSDS